MPAEDLCHLQENLEENDETSDNINDSAMKNSKRYRYQLYRTN